MFVNMNFTNRYAHSKSIKERYKGVYKVVSNFWTRKKSVEYDLDICLPSLTQPINFISPKKLFIIQANLVFRSDKSHKIHIHIQFHAH